MCKVSGPKLAHLDPVYTGADKFLNEQNLARFHSAFTRDRRNWTNFCVEVWDQKKEGPKLTYLAVQKFVQFRRSRVNVSWSRARVCSCKNLSGPAYTGLKNSPVPCKRKVELWKFFSVQMFVRIRVNGAPGDTKEMNKHSHSISFKPRCHAEY